METDWAENRAKINNDVIRRTLGKVLDEAFTRRRSATSSAPASRRALRPVRWRSTSATAAMEIYPDEAKNRTIWQPRLLIPISKPSFCSA